MPEPGQGQVRVRIAASAVNPIDISTRTGQITEAGLMMPAEQTSIGWDVAGRVEAVGEDVQRLAVGDAVVGLRDLLQLVPGAAAEFVVLDEVAVSRAPRAVSMAEAATLPLAGLTAARSLALADLSYGQSLLVTGAVGAVGGFVLELAALEGVQTIAVARSGDEALARRFGASAFVTSGPGLAERVRAAQPGGVDAIIDAAVLGVEAHAALRAGGTFVALVRPFAPPPIRGTTVLVQEAYADGAMLARLVALVDAGRLTLRVAETFPLERIAEAHERAERSGTRGRVVVTMG